MIDFYELLGLKKDATEKEIVDTYRKMIKKYHPDLNKSEEANRIAIILNKAKETLLDEKSRKEYDSLLNGINNSKQYSKDKAETYSARTKEYKETYSESYITKWQFFINYLKNGVDNKGYKFLRTILVIINFVFFKIVKLLSLVLIVTLNLLSGFIDFIAGIFVFGAILGIFGVGGSKYPNYVAFIPANVEMFLMFMLIAVIIELMKMSILDNSLNLYAVLQNIEDKIFINILMK